MEYLEASLTGLRTILGAVLGGPYQADEWEGSSHAEERLMAILHYQY